LAIGVSGETVMSACKYATKASPDPES
jgi:hypothetical protein